MSSLHQEKYFDLHIKIPSVRQTITGENEELLMPIFQTLGYKENREYFRQYVFEDKYVIDFAFPKGKIAIEMDGLNHRNKKQKTKDEERDKTLYLAGWVVIRIPQGHFEKNQGYYKSLIQQVVEERLPELSENIYDRAQGLLIVDVLLDNINELNTWSAYNNDDFSEAIQDLEVGIKHIKSIMQEEQA